MEIPTKENTDTTKQTVSGGRVWLIILGFGVKRYTNGDVYEGEWKIFKKHGRCQFELMVTVLGKGALTKHDGSTQIGEWVEDVFQH